MNFQLNVLLSSELSKKHLILIVFVNEIRASSPLSRALCLNKKILSTHKSGKDAYFLAIYAAYYVCLFAIWSYRED